MRHINARHADVADCHGILEQASLADRWIIFMPDKCIGESASETFERVRACIGWDRLSCLMKDLPQVINTMTMVGVVVRPYDMINTIYAALQKLVPQIGRCIDQYAVIFAFDTNRHPASLVFWFVWITIAPIIADTRDASRCAAAKNGEFHHQCQARALENSR